jgi:hypothetical protein
VAAARSLHEPYSRVLAMSWPEMLLALQEAQGLEDEDGAGLMRQLLQQLPHMM